MERQEILNSPDTINSTTPGVTTVVGDDLISQPEIGMVVQYKSICKSSDKDIYEMRAAIISRVHDLQPDGMTKCDLTTFYPSGMFFHKEVPQAKTPTSGHWNFIVPKALKK